METFTLEEVLERYLPLGQEIDFMNIDVEGLDYEVLISNNWVKYRPKVVLVEDLKAADLADAAQSTIFQVMTKQDYHLSCKTINTLIFERNEV